MDLTKDNVDAFVRKRLDAQMREKGSFSQIQGLRFIADRLNEVLAGKLPGLREAARSYTESFKDDELLCWEMMEAIAEAMTDQPSREKPLPSLRTALTGRPWNPRNRVQFLGIAIPLFNHHALENPVSLRLLTEKVKGKKGGIRYRIYPEHLPTTKMQEVLWFLWRFFFHDEGWKRLKRCPQCMKWFVDDTKNKIKERCSPHCTWQWWSRDRRKRSKHHISGRKMRKEG